MSIHPDTHGRIVKLQKDVEEIKEELEDQWHERRPAYEERVRKALEGDKNGTTLYLEIDGVRALAEIERDLKAKGIRIPTMSLWRAAKRLRKHGLTKKEGAKARSSIYAKKPWAKALDMDSYVRTQILKQEEPTD